MAFENGAMSPADISAMMGRNGFNDGYGSWWVMLLILMMFMGGGYGWGGNGYNNGAALNADIQRGFDQTATQASLGALQAQIGAGFADNAVANCQGNANITAAITNGQYATAQAIGNAKDTIALGLNQLAIANQQGFYDNKAGQADLKYTIATENCQDRQVISDSLRDLMAQNTANTNAIIMSQNQGFQGLQDKLCQMEIEGLKQANEQLRTQLNMAALAASQTQQTSDIVNALRIPAPIPAYTVPNPFTPTTTG